MGRWDLHVVLHIKSKFCNFVFFFCSQNLHRCFVVVSTSFYRTEFEGRSTNGLINQKSVLI